MEAAISEIVSLFERKGHSRYGGEEISQLDHALQSATMAQNELAAPSLITAALLHDLGHILHDLPDDAPDMGIDDLHENLAANFLEAHFPKSVTEPIKLHVAAKRYLCATSAVYMGMLSPSSYQSLMLQGGPMKPHEIKDFESNPYYLDAISIRTWDDNAKDPKMITQPLSAFIPAMESCLLHEVLV